MRTPPRGGAEQRLGAPIRVASKRASKSAAHASAKHARTFQLPCGLGCVASTLARASCTARAATAPRSAARAPLPAGRRAGARPGRCCSVVEVAGNLPEQMRFSGATKGPCRSVAGTAAPRKSAPYLVPSHAYTTAPLVASVGSESLNLCGNVRRTMAAGSERSGGLCSLHSGGRRRGGDNRRRGARPGLWEKQARLRGSRGVACCLQRRRLWQLLRLSLLWEMTKLPR